MDAESIYALSVPATYGRYMTREFPADQLWAGTGLTAADLEAPDRRITVRQLLIYVRNAVALAPQPDWYLDWSGRLADHFHGAISVALMSAPTLGDGLDAFLRFFPGRIPYMHMEGRKDGEHFAATLCPLIDLSPNTELLIEVPLMILQQYCSTVYPVDMSQAAFELAYPPTPHADRYGRYFKSPVHFNCSRNALVIPKAWRALPNIGYSADTWAHGLERCEKTMGSSPERNALGQVRTYLCAAFENKERERALPTLVEVAGHLHLSPRTLIRRLRTLGTTYQQIMDEFLRTRAGELLANEELKVKEIAAALGFDNPANFGKAFKRWHGVSPGTYRRRGGSTGRRPGKGRTAIAG
ncbi:MAG: AraC family transcriptional regulator ligand-binding domain-containing protein [Nevskia sp.]|nr:AraC family transcriptional regulator ligand-binding domain-containing protein [Nevskia sp.]